MVWIQDEKNHDFGWQVPKALLSTQAQGRKSHYKASYWLPQASYKKMPPKPQQAKASNHLSHKPKPKKKPHTSQTQRWIPKTLLISQGYYESAQPLWLPKQTSS